MDAKTGDFGSEALICGPCAGIDTDADAPCKDFDACAAGFLWPGDGLSACADTCGNSCACVGAGGNRRSVLVLNFVGTMVG